MPARGINKMPPKVVYPPGCKEISPDMSKEELLKRLKLLAKCFQEMGQDDNEKYQGLAVYLASELFLDHNSKDVKLLVACCIADIFRIFAPEAPYLDDGHVKEIFTFFVDQLRGLEDTEAPSFKRYFYLLENLAWVKSFNICLEFEDNQEIFCRLFKLIFGIVSTKHSSRVKNFMLDMMCPLITEADSVSQELLDIVLLNIIEPNKDLNKEAYQLAKDLIRRTANAIEPYIQAFFNNALMLGKTSESEVSDHLFALIYELNQISPSVLLAVLPQLEYKLKSNDDKERKSVTHILSKMFSDKNSDLAQTNKNLWLCYLGRFNDINVQIRTLCVTQSQHFILNHPELIKDITEQLKMRLHDPEEGVRMDCVLALINAAKKDLQCITSELLELIKERTLDKKFRIRKEALLGLGWIYKKCLMKDEPDPDEMKRVGWIRDKMLHGYYQINLDDRILIEKIFKFYLVPYTMDADARMKTLYHLYVNLDDNAVKALNEMLRCQYHVVSLVRQLIDVVEKEDTQEMRQLLAVRVMSLTRMLPEQTRNHENMKKFAQIVKDDPIIRQNLKTLVSSNCTCKKAEECVKEILKKTGHPTPQNVFYTSVKMLMERIAPVHIDVNAMKILMKLVNDSVSGIADIDDDVHDCGYKGMKLLQSLSTVYPGAFDSDEIFRYLLPHLKNEVDEIVELAIQIFKNTGVNIQEEHEDVYDNMLPVLVELAKEGTPEQAKQAVMCINIISVNKQPILSEIFDVLKQSLDPEAKNFQTALVSLGHIAQMCPGDFAVQMKNTIVQSIVKNLLMKNPEKPTKSTQRRMYDSWCDDDKVPRDTKAKMRAMKLMVRWLMGLKSNTMAENSGKSTLRMLYTTILHEGDLMETEHLSKAEMARLRLQAGCCMLKLAQEPVYADLISLEQFQGLAILINDDVYEVRTRFAAKLHKGLMSLKLRLEYMSILCLAANDPLKERQKQAKGYLQSNISKRREILKKQAGANELMFTILPDYVLPYAVHLLAHDPEFRSINDITVLNNLKDCLWFIMEPLITKNDNYSYNFYAKILDTIKQMKDAQDPDNEEANHKLYAICDLAMGIIATKTTSFMLKDFPVEPVLPKKLFIEDKSFTNNTKFYLPQEFAFSPPKKKQAAALMHGAAQIAAKPNKLLNGVVETDRPASPGSVTSGKSSGSSVDVKRKPEKKEPVKRSRPAKSKGPNAKKARLSSPPTTVESPVQNGVSPQSSGESSTSSAKLVKKPVGSLVQSKLSFTKDSGKENVKSSPVKSNLGNVKTAAKTSAKDTAKADEKQKKEVSKKGKKDTGDKTKKDSTDSPKVNEKTKIDSDVKANSAKKTQNLNEKNASNESPKKNTPKVINRTLGNNSVRGVSESPVKGSRSSSQESTASTRSSRGSITVKLSPPKKKMTNVKKNVKVVSKKLNSSPKKTVVNNKSRTKGLPVRPSPVKSKSSPNKKTLGAGKVSQSKSVNAANSRKSVSSPSKSVSSSSLKSGPASPRNSKLTRAGKNSKPLRGRNMSKSPATKVGQKRPATKNSKNASPAKKGKSTPTAARNVKKVVRKLSPELKRSSPQRKRSLSSQPASPAKRSRLSKSGSQSSSTTIPSTSSSKSPSPMKTLPSKSLPPKKRPNVRRAAIPNGTSDGGSTQSSRSASSSPRKSPRKPIPNKKFQDEDEISAGIQRKTKTKRR
ncbi:sister chromatid cohesion protein PDS5 homolog A-like [Lineus longissimus]|uniref:sister chromatid cohesion protein PDS5 homolog A-like n=1 Tax=Lineus longissimus TaxID=88925 RepID=UPI002B4EBA23